MWPLRACCLQAVRAAEQEQAEQAAAAAEQKEEEQECRGKKRKAGKAAGGGGGAGSSGGKQAQQKGRASAGGAAGQAAAKGGKAGSKGTAATAAPAAAWTNPHNFALVPLSVLLSASRQVLQEAMVSVCLRVPNPSCLWQAVCQPGGGAVQAVCVPEECSEALPLRWCESAFPDH